MEVHGFLLEKAVKEIRRMDPSIEIEMIMTGEERRNNLFEPTETRVVGVRKFEKKMILIIAQF